MKKKILAVLVCMTMLLSMTGCGRDEITLAEEEDIVEISFSWWGTDPRHDYTMEAVKKFEEMHPNIQVHMEYSEWTGYDRKNAVVMASNTEADVMQINFSWLNKYSPDGSRYYDLESLSDLDLTTFSSDILDYGRSNGVLNALPIALNSKVFLYNEELYESFGLSVPETWDDFYKAAQKMSVKGIYPLDLDSTAAFMTSVAYVEQSTGKPFFDSNNKLNFGQEEVRTMLEFYLGLVENKVVEYMGERNDSSYKEGIYAGTVQWITNAEKYQKNLFEGLEQTTVIGKVPMLSGATTTGWYAKPASMYVISSNTKHPKEAAMLLDYLVNSEEMAVLQGMEKGVPVSTSAKSALETAGMMTGIQTEAQTVIDNTQTKIMSPNYEDSGLQTAFKDALDSILYNNADVETEAVKAYAAMKNALK